MFSQACVNNSVHRGHVWQRACMVGTACMGCVYVCGGGRHGGGCAWRGGHVWLGGGMCGGGGGCMVAETATAADAMHPTGIHSCIYYYFARLPLLYGQKFFNVIY